MSRTHRPDAGFTASDSQRVALSEGLMTSSVDKPIRLGESLGALCAPDTSAGVISRSFTPPCRSGLFPLSFVWQS